MLSLFGWIALAGSFLVASHFPPWTAFQQELLAAFGGCLLLTGTLIQQRRWTWPAFAVAAIAMAAIPLLQAAFGQIIYLADAWLAALYLVGLGLAVALGATLMAADGDRFLDALSGTLLAAALLSTGLAMAQLFQTPLPPFDIAPMRPGGRPYANLSQPNHLATLLLLGMVVAVGLWERRRLGRATLAVVLLWLGLGLVATQSRAGLIGLVVVAGWLLWARSRRLLRFPAVPLTAFVASCLAATALWPLLLDALHLVAGRDESGMTATGSRPGHWTAFAAAVLREPWLGYGWNQVIVAQGEIAGSVPAVLEMLDHSHNLLLDLLLWNGVPLGAAVIAAFGWWLWKQAQGAADATAVTLVAGVLALGVHAMLEYPFSYAYFLLPFGLLVGALEAGQPLGPRIAVPRPVTASLLALATATTIAVAIDYVGIDDNHRRLRLETLGIARASTVDDVPPAMLVGNWREFLVFARTQARAGMSEAELERMHRVYRRFPQPPVLLRYAIAAGLNGRTAEAHEALLRLCRIHPVERCDEGRAAWQAMIGNQYPQLAAVTFPEAR